MHERPIGISCPVTLRYRSRVTGADKPQLWRFLQAAPHDFYGRTP
jgi:hypothetical protein